MLFIIAPHMFKMMSNDVYNFKFDMLPPLFPQIAGLLWI